MSLKCESCGVKSWFISLITPLWSLYLIPLDLKRKQISWTNSSKNIWRNKKIFNTFSGNVHLALWSSKSLVLSSVSIYWFSLWWKLSWAEPRIWWNEGMMEMAKISWWIETRPPFFASASKITNRRTCPIFRGSRREGSWSGPGEATTSSEWSPPLLPGQQWDRIQSLVFLNFRDLPLIQHWLDLIQTLFFKYLLKKLTLPLSISLRMVFLYCF